MRSGKLPKRVIVRGAALAVAAAIVCSAGGVRADDREVCISSYDKTQALRQQGKLKDAHEQAVACLSAACPAFVKVDCAKWLNEIEASQPSVVLDVRDREGRATNAVHVSLDGKAWLDALDGTAKPVDPGQHVLRYAIEGAPPREETVQILEGEKNRRLSVSFAPPAAATAAPSAAPPPAPASGSSTKRAAGWVVGGAGVVVLGIGAAFGVLTLSDASTVKNGLCKGGVCTTSAGDAAASAAETKSLVASVAIPVGLAAIGGGVLLIATSPAGKGSASAGSWVAVRVDGPGAAVVGRF